MPKGNKKGEAPRYRNISVDADLVEAIHKVSERLEVQFGFRPTLSQTLRHMINVAEQQ